MENTPLGLESFSPDYMSYFYHLSQDLKRHYLQLRPTCTRVLVPKPFVIFMNGFISAVLEQ